MLGFRELLNRVLHLYLRKLHALDKNSIFVLNISKIKKKNPVLNKQKLYK